MISSAHLHKPQRSLGLPLFCDCAFPVKDTGPLAPLLHSQGAQRVACDVSQLTLNDISPDLIISTQLRWPSEQMPQETAPTGPRDVFIFQRELKPPVIAYKLGRTPYNVKSDEVLSPFHYAFRKKQNLNLKRAVCPLDPSKK